MIFPCVSLDARKISRRIPDGLAAERGANAEAQAAASIVLLVVRRGMGGIVTRSAIIRASWPIIRLEWISPS
jgi:hypothetical protein